MSTIIVFTMSLLQLVAVAAGYFAPLPILFDAVLIYGSPIYIVFNLLGGESIATNAGSFFPLIVLFHIVKYSFLCHSQFNTERHGLHYAAATLEVVYLALGAYYF